MFPVAINVVVLACKCIMSSSTASELSCRLEVLVHAWYPVLRLKGRRVVPDQSQPKLCLESCCSAWDREDLKINN